MFRSRPFGVTLLLWMVLTLIVWGAARFFAALQWRAVLAEFGSSLSVGYLSVSGAGWSAAGGVLLWSMFTGKAWTRLGILSAIGLWLIEYWIERLFFQSSRANLPFAIVGSLLILGVALVCALHKSTKDFFMRSEEYEQQNKDSSSK